MSRTIYLVRHAMYSNPQNVVAGRLPMSLSEDGRTQAQKLHTYFADKNIAKIYSSAVQRCKETSEIIAGNGVISITFDQRLLEGFSAAQGISLDERKEDWKVFYAHTSELGGETPEQIQERMIDFFGEVVVKPEGNIIICSHGDPLYFLYLHLTNQDQEMPKQWNTQADLLPTYPQKASIRPIQLTDTGLQVGELILM